MRGVKYLHSVIVSNALQRKMDVQKKDGINVQSDKAETIKTECPHWSSVRGIP